MKVRASRRRASQWRGTINSRRPVAEQRTSRYLHWKRYQGKKIISAERNIDQRNGFDRIVNSSGLTQWCGHVTYLLRYLCSSSRLASGRIWFLTPLKMFDVASDAIMTGRTRVGGMWRSTPPTAPVRPFCSCSCTGSDALQIKWAYRLYTRLYIEKR